MEGIFRTAAKELGAGLSWQNQTTARQTSVQKIHGLFEAADAIWKAPNNNKTAVFGVPLPAFSAQKTGRVIEFPLGIDRPPRRDQFRARRATLTEALKIAFLMKDESVFRNTTVHERFPTERAEEAIDMELMSTKFNCFAISRKATRGADPYRNIRNRPEGADRTILSNWKFVSHWEKTVGSVVSSGLHASFPHWVVLRGKVRRNEVEEWVNEKRTQRRIEADIMDVSVK
jgi:hypothetical protein